MRGVNQFSEVEFTGGRRLEDINNVVKSRLLPVVFRLLSVVFRLLSVVFKLLLVVSRLLSDLEYMKSQEKARDIEVILTICFVPMNNKSLKVLDEPHVSTSQ